ncbi:MAG: hypothetical protein NZ853_09550 [Leptospiraceae bacterium]|nr:hypothetical protein [Leptospiraceae bacterium]MDW7976939.1 hypothetical protein [Leptospiraceae bacterium]
MKFFILFLSLSLNLFLVSFLFKKEEIYIPPIQFSLKNFNEQKDFQWLHKKEFFYQQKAYPLPSEFLYAFSILPNGFVRFQKVGSSIEYFISPEQLLWKKERFSYPYFEPYGRWIFLINSDRTAFEVLDLNGNSLVQVNGSFLVDIKCHTEDDICFFLFSDGKLVSFYKNQSFEFFLQKPNSFFKSLSLRDQELAVHYYSQNQDVFEIFDIRHQDTLTLKSKNTIQSPIVFPFTLPFVFYEDNIMFPNGENTILIQKAQVYEITSQTKTNEEVSKNLIRTQKDLKLHTNFLGDSLSYGNLFFVVKPQNLEVYSLEGEQIFSLFFEKNYEPMLFLYHHKVFVFLDREYLELNFL